MIQLAYGYEFICLNWNYLFEGVKDVMNTRW